MKLTSALALLLFAAFWADMARSNVRLALLSRAQGDAARCQRDLAAARADARHHRALVTIWASHSLPH